jgi:hypothetical protein
MVLDIIVYFASIYVSCVCRDCVPHVSVYVL